MDLKQIASEIRQILEDKRKELELTFVEDTHTYYMKDLNGEIRTNQRLSSKLRSRRSSSRSLQRSNESRGGLVKEEAKAETKVS